MAFRTAAGDLVPMSERFIEAVRRWADRVLEAGKDRYGDKQTPLLVDGVRVENGEPVAWLSQGEEWILSNPANQQNLFRTLTGLSQLTGDQRYIKAARLATEYALKHLRYGDLMCWGGHMAYDLNSKKQIHASDKGPQHELKCHYPFYEFMLEINRTETQKMIEAMWESHVRDWNNLEFNRHGQPKEYEGTTYKQGGVWDRSYRSDPVFFTGKGLTFVNAGSDLYYSAAVVGALTKQEAPIEWAERLAARYAETAHPETGMTGYQFSISELPGQRGDRAAHQFGEQLANDQPIEATLSVPGQIHAIAGESALCRMAIYDLLGERGRRFLDWALADLQAYGRYAYDERKNVFHPVLTNGKRLTGLVLEKDGYYGRRGEALSSKPADGLMFWSYAAGYRRSEDPELWHIVRNMGRGLGLGDLDKLRQAGTLLPCGTKCSNTHVLFGLLELAAIHPESHYLTLAEEIGDHILANTFHHGFFLPSKRHVYARFDSIDPLALLHLSAEMQGNRSVIPSYFGGKAFFAADYDGNGHRYDSSFIYSLVKD
ncbi:hypothetical protein [Paenibacillus lemnae]|uniref:Pectate lyase n=1 Tax=Paenibacillus lemnae TaxID=1330551 RepID=A0A848M6S2_PAELE|nr:hypothetical protein [Paenibacillus lemnae]NMO95543.1 hypothetical protein [Paenibacillus lemnae]